MNLQLPNYHRNCDSIEENETVMSYERKKSKSLPSFRDFTESLLRKVRNQIESSRFSGVVSDT